MLLEARLLDERREGKAEGRVEGKAEEKIQLLNSCWLRAVILCKKSLNLPSYP